MTPGEPIELNPLPSDCQIYDGPVSISKVETLENISILENPINDFLTIENDSGKQINIQIVDIIGYVKHF